MAQKLWEKNFEVNKEIERFTVGRDRELDLYLAKYDVLGSMAHITMLESIGLLGKEELPQLLAELKNIYAIAEKGEFVIEDGVEDVHSQVELMLTQKLGDMGKKIHSGRSRNDQVLVDLKLFTRHELKEIVDAVKILFDELIQKSEQYKNVLMPGYTHLQVAMPSSFGLWFGAYAESLADDMLFLQAAYRMTNRNPLGSAAGYGSSFPLNRTMTTQLLGFAAKYGKMCCQCDWPTYDETKTVDTTVTMAVQVLGKLKGTVTVAKDSDQQTVVDAALQLDKVQRQMEGMQIVKVIHVPNKLVNLILKPKA